MKVACSNCSKIEDVNKSVVVQMENEIIAAICSDCTHNVRKAKIVLSRPNNTAVLWYDQYQVLLTDVTIGAKPDENS